MTESILRIAYLAMGIYSFASALLTTMIFSRGGVLSPVSTFSVGSIWVSFIAFVLLVTWASKSLTARPGHPMSESFLRTSFLAMGLFFFTCALCTTMTFSASSVSTEWFCIGGLWVSFFTFAWIVASAGKVKKPSGSAHPVDEPHREASLA